MKTVWESALQRKVSDEIVEKVKSIRPPSLLTTSTGRGPIDISGVDPLEEEYRKNPSP